MAGKITQTFIDELMNRLDIVEVIDARVPLKKTGREYTACCPFHNEKTPSFTVSPNKQFYHCFGCGAHGTAVGFLMEYEHMSFPEAIEDLAGQAGMQVQYETNSNFSPRAKKPDDSLYELLAKCDQYYRQQLRQHPLSKQAVGYLKQRGLSGEIAAEFGLGFAPPGWDNLQSRFADSAEKIEKLVSGGMLIKKEDNKTYDRFRNRIMFPIRDRRGRTIGFGGRILPQAQGAENTAVATGRKTDAKYLNSPETPLFHKGQELYGLYEARQALRDIQRLLVVEGYMDVVALAQFGIRNAVATLGTATTEEHLHKLFRLTKEVVFCFDGDRAGRDAAWRALNNALPVMREGRQIRFMFLADGEDPDSFVRKVKKEGFEEEINKALTFSDFFFSWLGKQADTTSIDGRAQLVALASPLITKLPPGVFSHMMRNQLAQLARIENNELDGLLAQTLKKTANRDVDRRTASEASENPGFRPAPRGKYNKKQPLTPVRTALMRVLYQPELAQEAGEPSRFTELAIPGVELLVKILETLQAHPHLGSSAILERWRDSEHGPHLEKLVAWTPELDNSEALKTEFLGALARLDQQCAEQRYDFLLTRSNQGELSPGEKSELKELFVHINRGKQREDEQK